MEIPAYPRFLENARQYEASERYWEEIWTRIDESSRKGFGWSYPWVGTGSPLIKDGNPIFSAHSPRLRRGVRVIQVEPVDLELDIQAWLSTFGGDAFGPDSINELVIACVPSEPVADLALSLMTPWVMGLPVSLGESEGGVIIPSVDG